MRTSSHRLLAPLFLALAVAACGGKGGDAPPDGAPRPQCSDGLDNDGDGQTDYPDDLGCPSATGADEGATPAPRCNDGRDNDGDGKTDFPQDPGCVSANADDEADPCPSGAGCPQCANGQDDDGNGKADYPDDPGCTSAADNDEFTEDPQACGPGVAIQRLSGTGTDAGMLAGTGSKLASPTCGGTAAEVVYELRIAAPQVLVASTDNAGTTIDTALYLRGAACAMASSEVACSDDLGPSNTRSRLTASLQPGVYYLVVDNNTAASGAFELTTTFAAGEGTACTATAQCGTGLVCRVPLGGTTMVCAPPVCRDGVDDDGDGELDFPDDPGCASADDGDEADDCGSPSPVNCPDCANHVDDDGDGAVDYPADTTCASAGGVSEACDAHEPVVRVTSAMTSGDTSAATSDYDPSCSFDTGAPDVTLRLDLPALQSLDLEVQAGFDTATMIFGASCGGTEVTCSDPNAFSLTGVAAGTYYVVVDGYFAFDSGPFTLVTSGVIANGASCESPLAQAGALRCGPGYACLGAVGSRTCGVAPCADGIDNDGDGKKDYPLDPGCASPSDATEADDCPSGAGCPKCANGLDDDGDGLVDYPADTKCAAAGQDTEAACGIETDGVTPLTTPTATGTLVGATDDLAPTCAGTGGVDRVFSITVPALQSLTIDNLGSAVDSSVSLWNATCGAPALGCGYDGFSSGSLTVTGLAAGTYVIDVDAYASFTTPDAFALHVSGAIAAGGSCEGPLAASGALACGSGLTCKGAMGARTCAPAACADGLDNDADGKQDYPLDPGCASPSDDAEADDCPSGPTCPVCSNGLDDDGDGKTDYPLDLGCASAGGTTEAFCATETDVVAPLVSATMSGTTAGKHDDLTPGCGFSSAPEVTYALVLPIAVDTLTIDTDGSGFDTILSIRDATCGAELLCNDDGGASGLTSRLVLTGVQAGAYAVSVDGSGANSGAYFLNVRGIAPPGSACTSPLFSSGVLVCALGQTCTAGRCQ